MCSSERRWVWVGVHAVIKLGNPRWEVLQLFCEVTSGIKTSPSSAVGCNEGD